MNEFAPFMRLAVSLAERGRWHTAPNPTVGAVLVRDGHVVAQGWHAVCGEAHAEINCLDDARRKGIAPSECTLVVTLEPCNHTGKTPPCTQAILAAGIRRVIVGLKDPNPQAAGGAAFLAECGVHVETGVEEELCRDLVADFLVWQSTGRPYVLLKMAATIDGRIATRTGHSRWISGEPARNEVHRLRAGVGLAGGAVLVGGNTLTVDNPRLTARDTPVEKQPLACAILSRLPGDHLVLFQDRAKETVLFTTAAGAASTRALALRQRGVRVVGLNDWNDPHGNDLIQALTWLRQEAGCFYVLCEGGGTLGRSLLETGLVDEFHLYLSPKVLGDNDARPLFDGRSPQTMEDAIGLRITRTCQLGDDCHLTLRPQR